MSKHFYDLVDVPVLQHLIAAIFLLDFHLTWKSHEKALQRGGVKRLRFSLAEEMKKLHDRD